jgi:hypothetical protein
MIAATLGEQKENTMNAKTPARAVPRVCEGCKKRFRAMTDLKWQNVRRIHEQNSKRHWPNPLMSPSHVREMDNDVRNRAIPGPWSDRRLSDEWMGH